MIGSLHQTIPYKMGNYRLMMKSDLIAASSTKSKTAFNNK
jgi:hypothetical protein